VGADGLVYVTDDINGAVQVFSATGVYQYNLGGKRLFRDAQGISVGPDGRLYVAVHRKSDGFQVQVFSAKGAFLDTLGRFGASGANGQLYSQLDAAVAPNGTIYVVDTFWNRLQIFAAH
jgi:DNA-binding beta-propeller fold protein YncE